MAQAVLSQVWAVKSLAAMAPAAAGLPRCRNSMGTTRKPKVVRLPHQRAASRMLKRGFMMSAGQYLFFVPFRYS